MGNNNYIDINEMDQDKLFLISEKINENGNASDLLVLINFLLYDLINKIRYEQETEQDKKTFEKICKIKDQILKIKNKYIKGGANYEK